MNHQPVNGEVAELSLTVSSPALLLNHMAERYASTSRILMEFVDNALDDAEGWFDGEQYTRDVDIDVFVSIREKTLQITDNCAASALRRAIKQHPAHPDCPACSMRITCATAPQVVGCRPTR